MLSLPLVATKALGDPDTDSEWPIGDFVARLSVGGPKSDIAIFVKNILDEQHQIQVQIVISKVGPRIKD